MLRFLLNGRTILPILAAIVALLVATPAWAQTAGQLRVTVVDDDMELPIPGVQLTLTGETLIGGAQERTTDANGQHLFTELPPGTYTLRAVKAGFQGLTLDGIEILVNRTTVQVAKMTAGDGVSEDIVVVDKKVINTEDTSRGQVLTKDFLERVPAGRSYQSAVQMASGVQGEGGNPNMAGAAYNENTYMLDGANITDPVTGTFSLNFNFDAIQQIEVLLGGYMPEYGTSVGGIVNVVTRTGTNNLEFEASVYYENGNLRPRMDQRLTADGQTLAPTGFDSTNQFYQFNGLIAGPIVRDKAWFIISYSGNRRVAALTGVPQTWDFDGHYLLTRLTVQPNTEHRLSMLFQTNPTTIDNINQGSPFIKPEAQGRQAQGGFLAQGRWQWFLSPEANLDTSLMVQKIYLEVTGVPCTHDTELGYHPCFPGEMENNVDWETPGRIGSFGAYDSVNWGANTFDDRFRYQANSKLSILSVEDPLKGTHDFKFGVTGDQLVWDQISGYSGNSLFIDLNLVAYDPQTFMSFYWLETSGPIKFRTTGSTFSWFAQDSYKPISNLTINYGLRFDNFVYRNDLGEPVIAGNLLGPRVFAAWDPFGDQKTKIATGWGRFNDTGRLAVASYTSAGGFGQKIWYGEIYGGNDGLGFLNSGSLEALHAPAENLNIAHDELRSPRVDEVILMLEREIIEDVAAFSSMSGKLTRYMYEPDELNFIYDSDGSTIIGGRYGETLNSYGRLRTPALAKRDYFQWDLGLRKVESRRWGGQATYTYTQSVGSSAIATSGSFMNDPQTQFIYGNLLTDRVHTFITYGYWDLPTDPWTQRVGFLFRYNDGFPYNRLYYAEDMGGSSGGYNLYIEPRGTYFRLNPYWYLNLSFRQDIDVRKGKLFVDFQVENITNNRAPDNVLATPLFANNRLLVFSRQAPLTLRLGVGYEF